MLLTLLEREDSEVAQSWLRLPPKRNEERELLKLEVLDPLLRDPGTSMSALIG